jgi:hypothetical protein
MWASAIIRRRSTWSRRALTRSKRVGELGRLFAGLTEADERQAWRKAAGWELDVEVAGAQHLRGVAEGSEEFGVGIVERAADLLAEGVHARSRRFLQMFGMAVGILGQDGLPAEGLLVTQGGLGFELDLAHPVSDAEPGLIRGEPFAAGQRVERQGLDRRIAEAVEVLSPLACGVRDPGAIGRQIDVNDVPRTIVGIMPPCFAYPARQDGFQRILGKGPISSRDLFLLCQTDSSGRGTLP